jgi:hypothetical protein
MEVGGLGPGQIDMDNDISLLLDVVEGHAPLDTQDTNHNGTLEMLSDYISTVKNLPTDSAVHKTLEESDHNPSKLDYLRSALFSKVKQCQAFPTGSYTLKRRINRGEKVTMKYAKDCVLLCKFIADGEFEDINDMLNIVSENSVSVIDCSTPGARGRDMSFSQAAVATTQCDCNSAISQLKELITQLRTDVAMLTTKCETQDNELSQFRNSYNTLSHSLSTDLQTMQDKMRTHTDRCGLADSLPGEITQISLEVEKLKEHKNTGVGLNRSMIKALKDDVTVLKQYKADAVEQHCVMVNGLSTLGNLSKSVSSMNKTLSTCTNDIAGVKLGTDRLRDDKGMGISQIKSQVKSITQDISGLDDRVETVCQSNKTQNEGNTNIRARMCSLEKSVSTLFKSFDSAKHVSISATQCHAQTMDASITGILGNFAHDMTDQFAALSNVMKHSLTDITSAINGTLPSLTTSHANQSRHASVENTGQDAEGQASNSTLLMNTPHANNSHHARIDNPVQTVVSQISNGTPHADLAHHANVDKPAQTDAGQTTHDTLLVTKSHVHDSHHASVVSYAQTAAGHLPNGTYPCSNLMLPDTSAPANTCSEVAGSSIGDGPAAHQPPRGTAQSEYSASIPVTIGNRGPPNRKGVTNIATEDGFVGVARRQTVRFFLSGIGLSTTADNISKYLSDRDVSFSVIRMMSSKRHNSQSARINILKDDVPKINERDFWPAGVMYRKWQSKPMFSRSRDPYAEDSDNVQPESSRPEY